MFRQEAAASHARAEQLSPTSDVDDGTMCHSVYFFTNDMCDSSGRRQTASDDVGLLVSVDDGRRLQGSSCAGVFEVAQNFFFFFFSSFDLCILIFLGEDVHAVGGCARCGNRPACRRPLWASSSSGRTNRRVNVLLSHRSSGSVLLSSPPPPPPIRSSHPVVLALEGGGVGRRRPHSRS